MLRKYLCSSSSYCIWTFIAFEVFRKKQQSIFYWCCSIFRCSWGRWINYLIYLWIWFSSYIPSIKFPEKGSLLFLFKSSFNIDFWLSCEVKSGVGLFLYNDSGHSCGLPCSSNWLWCIPIMRQLECWGGYESNWRFYRGLQCLEGSYGFHFK